jgi:hypothetical protein
MKIRRSDEYHGWTSVISWRLLAVLRMHAMGMAPESEAADLAAALLELQSRPHGFWYMNGERREPYRGIVNAAQPLVALAAFIENDFDHPLAALARDALERCRDVFVFPLLETNPFGIMPYGLYAGPRTTGDTYHQWKDGLVYRFFMPESAPEKVNHGLSSHWTSWAHGLACLGRALDDNACRDAAFEQLAWLLGNNPLNASMITGVGVRNASPYSRFYGTLPGGFSVGPRGNADDTISIDMDGRTVWSSGEYWMTPLANALQALAQLLPGRILASGKLGAR